MERRELTDEELREAIAGILAENRDNIPRPAKIQCNGCRHLQPRTATCKAYPEGIPFKVMTGEGCPDLEPKEEKAERL